MKMADGACRQKKKFFIHSFKREKKIAFSREH